MSPTCSKRDLAGRNALSATDLTNLLSSGASPLAGARPRASPKRRRTGRLCDEAPVRHPQPTSTKRVAARLRVRRALAPSARNGDTKPERGGYRAWYVARAFGVERSDSPSPEGACPPRDGAH